MTAINKQYHLRIEGHKLVNPATTLMDAYASVIWVYADGELTNKKRGSL